MQKQNTATGSQKARRSPQRPRQAATLLTVTLDSRAARYVRWYVSTFHQDAADAVNGILLDNLPQVKKEWLAKEAKGEAFATTDSCLLEGWQPLIVQAAQRREAMEARERQLSAPGAAMQPGCALDQAFTLRTLLRKKLMPRIERMKKKGAHGEALALERFGCLLMDEAEAALKTK